MNKKATLCIAVLLLFVLITPWFIGLPGLLIGLIGTLVCLYAAEKIPVKRRKK